jgi:hypothetical protein
MAGTLDGSYFQELEILDVDSCAFSTLDVQNNPALKKINCASNRLSALDLSRNVNLWQLNCANNNITGLDVSHNLDMGVLNCSTNQLSTLDLSKQARLVSLYCAGNNLTALNLSGNPNLAALDCANNSISALDLTGNGKLAFLSCSGNPLNTSMSMAETTGLKTLYAADTQLKGVDVSQNRELILLYSPNNSIKSLNVAVNQDLRVLVCPYNNLSKLDLSANVNLDWLDCSDNRLKEVTVGHGLSTLYFGNNLLKFSTMQVGDASEHGEISGLTQLVDAGLVERETLIDLSSEYEIYGSFTTFQWFDGLTPITLPDWGYGYFYADPAYLYRTLTCQMSNPAFPGTTVNYHVTIDTITKGEDGIQASKTQNQLTVYPNPVRDVLHIKALSPIKSVEIYDMSGRLVKNEAQESSKYEISVNDMPQGIYVLKTIGLSGRALTSKIEKQ